MGRLQLRTWDIYFVNTSYFATEVAPYGSDPETEEVVVAKFAEFSAKTLGATALTLGTPLAQDGTYKFQVYGPSTSAVISLVNDSHVASNFEAAEWEGFYQNRVQR